MQRRCYSIIIFIFDNMFQNNMTTSARSYMTFPMLIQACVVSHQSTLLDQQFHFFGNMFQNTTTTTPTRSYIAFHRRIHACVLSPKNTTKTHILLFLHNNAKSHVTHYFNFMLCFRKPWNPTHSYITSLLLIQVYVLSPQSITKTHILLSSHNRIKSHVTRYFHFMLCFRAP